MHDEIRFNRFRSKYDNAVKAEGDYSWSELVDLFSEHAESSDKEHVSLFNLVRYEDIQILRRDGRDFGVDDESYEFVPLRRLSNVKEVDALVLDYDGEMTIEEAKKRFENWTHLGYSSYNHLAKRGVQKFRLIFPLAVPIPLGQFAGLSNALVEFAGPCDPVVLNPNQHYYFPATHPDRKNLAVAWHKAARVLDWRHWPSDRPTTIHRDAAASGKTHQSNISGDLNPEQMFTHRKGAILAKNVVGRIQNVQCPFHQDANPTEFLNRFDDSGIVCFRCKRCGTFLLTPDRASNAKQQAKPPGETPRTEEPLEQRRGSLLDEVFGFHLLYLDAPTRDLVQRQLQKIKRAILSDRGEVDLEYERGEIVQETAYKTHIILMPEGAGKSQLALDLVLPDRVAANVTQETADLPLRDLRSQARHRQDSSGGRRVVFACRSWQQVFEKYDRYDPILREHGLHATIMYSIDGSLLRRFDIRANRKPARPFKTGELKRDETFQRIRRKAEIDGDGASGLSTEFVQVFWALIEDESEDPLRFSQICRYDDAQLEVYDLDNGDRTKELLQGPAMVFTTFARLRLIEAMHDSIPINWLIWIDDPDVDDLLNIHPVERSTNPKRSKIVKNTQVINGREYYVRERQQWLGHALSDHRCIYTTTEKAVQQLLGKALKERNERYVVHDFLEPVQGGKITILGTKRVQRRYDALIPLLVRRLNKNRSSRDGAKAKPLLLIADGLGSEFNHSNVKGRNDLSSADLLIELSKPHYEQITTISDAVGAELNSHGHDPAKTLMLDRLHQAVGRNSGYRTKDGECVVLVDSSFHEHLVENCRYRALDKISSVQMDRTQAMRRGETRVPADASTLAKEVDAFLNDPFPYLCDNRKVQADIEHVVKGIQNVEKRYSYVARLLCALTAYAGCRFDETNASPESTVVDKVRSLGIWVLEVIVPESQRATVMRQYVGFFETNQSTSNS